MMIVSTSLPKRYTKAQLLEEARARHYPVTERLLIDWVERGLLGRPERHGQGRKKGVGAWWSQRQLELWLTLLHHRQKGATINALYNIPVSGWLYWDQESGVALSQVRQAMASWVKANRTSRSVKTARQGSRELVQLAANPGAWGKREVIDALTAIQLTGQTADQEDLYAWFEQLIDPQQQGKMKGPIGAQLSPGGLSGMILARQLAMKHLDTIPHALWEWGRLLLATNLASYQQEQPRFASDPNLGYLFRAVDLEMLVNAACEDLLTVLGLSQLVIRQGWRLNLSAPLDMNDWLEGRMTASLKSHVVRSPLILPQGQQRLNLEVAVSVMRREN